MGSKYSGSNLHGKGDIKKCNCYGAVKLFEYIRKMVERVLGNSICGIVTLDEKRFVIIPERQQWMVCLF